WRNGTARAARKRSPRGSVPSGAAARALLPRPRSACPAPALLVPPPRFAPAPALGCSALSSWLTSDFLTLRACDPLLGTFLEQVARTDRLLAVRVDQRHVAHVDRRLLGHDAAFLGTPGALKVDLLVLADDVHPVDEHPLLVRVDEDDLALAAAVATGDHHDVIALLDLHRGRPALLGCLRLLRHLDPLRRERDDPHEPLLPQPAADRAEDTGAARVSAVPDQDGRVLIETDVGAITPAALLARAHHHRLDHVTLAHGRPGKGVLHGGHDDIANARVSPAGAAEHADAQDLLGSGVVGDLEPRLLLNHVNSCFCDAGHRGGLAGGGPGARPQVVTWPSPGSR